MTRVRRRARIRAVKITVRRAVLQTLPPGEGWVERPRWIAGGGLGCVRLRSIMARSKRPPSWSPVAIERAGKAYSGRFYVDGRLITVLYNGRTKTTQLGGSDATAIASRLLSELLPEK
jgi:hypothetical protein